MLPNRLSVPASRSERPAGRRQLAPSRGAQLRKTEAQIPPRRDDGGGNDHAREPFVVRGDDVPGGPRARGAPDHVLVGRHVLLPGAALEDVAEGELPVLVGLVEALEEPASLLVLRNMKEELH